MGTETKKGDLEQALRKKPTQKVKEDALIRRKWQRIINLLRDITAQYQAQGQSPMARRCRLHWKMARELRDHHLGGPKVLGRALAKKK